MRIEGSCNNEDKSPVTLDLDSASTPKAESPRKEGCCRVPLRVRFTQSIIHLHGVDIEGTAKWSILSLKLNYCEAVLVWPDPARESDPVQNQIKRVIISTSGESDKTDLGVSIGGAGVGVSTGGTEYRSKAEETVHTYRDYPIAFSGTLTTPKWVFKEVGENCGLVGANSVEIYVHPTDKLQDATINATVEIPKSKMMAKISGKGNALGPLSRLLFKVYGGIQNFCLKREYIIYLE